MKTRILCFGLAVWLFCLGLCFSGAAAGSGRINLVAEQFVEDEAKEQARLAVEATVKFFHHTYDLALEKDLKILLVPDEAGYIKALKRWHNLDGVEAEKWAARSSGASKGAHIVVNVSRIRSDQGQLFCLCHEMVHQFQRQVSGDRREPIRWVSEGVADAMAAHIMETAGLGGAVDYRRVWQGKRQNAAGGPRLENLHTQKEWFAALEAYGGGATYGTAALAVLALRQRHGYEPLLAYFRALSRLSPEDAFHQTFGVRLSSFERDFEY